MIPSPFEFYLSHPKIGPALREFQQVFITHAEKEKLPIEFELPKDFSQREIITFTDVLSSIGWSNINESQSKGKTVLKIKLS